MSYRSAEDYRNEQSSETRANMSRLRRLAVSVTSRVFWQLLGYKSHEGKRETTEAEVFSGIGFFSRPKKGTKSEAILASIHDARHSVVIATRNEDVRRAIANLDEDETCIFTSLGIIVIKANGTVEIRSKDGAAVPLALKSDVDELRAKLNALIVAYKAHVHIGVSSGTATSGIPDDIDVSSAGAMVGTSVLRSE